MQTPPDRCVGGCDRPMLPDRQFRETPRPQRVGIVRHGARGLCAACYRRHGRQGTLHDFDRPTHTQAEVLAEWAILPGRRGMSRAQGIRSLAGRMGMTAKAVERHLDRATEAGLLTPTRVAA